MTSQLEFATELTLQLKDLRERNQEMAKLLYAKDERIKLLEAGFFGVLVDYKKRRFDFVKLEKDSLKTLDYAILYTLGHRANISFHHSELHKWIEANHNPRANFETIRRNCQFLAEKNLGLIRVADATYVVDASKLKEEEKSEGDLKT